MPIHPNYEGVPFTLTRSQLLGHLLVRGSAVILACRADGTITATYSSGRYDTSRTVSAPDVDRAIDILHETARSNHLIPRTDRGDTLRPLQVSPGPSPQPGDSGDAGA